MTDAAARGRLAVRPTSWHYRVHAWWARDKGLPSEQPTDLCHYFWRVILWAPLRFFFLHGPAALLGILAAAVGLLWCLVTWHSEIAHALAVAARAGWIIAALTLGGFAAFVVLTLFVRLLLGWNMEVVTRRIDRAFDGIAAVWMWFWTKPLIRTRWVGFSPFAFVLAALYVWVCFIDLRLALYGLGGLLAICAALFVAVVAVVMLIDFFKDRKARKAALKPKDAEATPEPTPEDDRVREPSWSGLRVLWAFLVAKKHRVCPLIEIRP